MKPNIVLIVLDEMRADCIGAAGHPDVKTPYLDTLINNGVLFNNAYTACPSCVPARAALYTGLNQKNHGRVGYQDRVNWNYDKTIATELTKQGYYTQCVGKMHVHPLRNLMGFHNIELHDGYLHNYRLENIGYYENQLIADDYFYWLKDELGISTDVTDTGIDCNSWMARPWIYDEKYHPTNWVTNRSLDFLRRRDRDKPFLLMASYVRPHAPYDAPQAFFDMYKDKDLRSPVNGDWNDGERRKKIGVVFNSLTGPEDEELIRAQQAGYYACISHLDNQIGKLMLGLIERNMMDNTVFIVTADHGEMLSDHKLIRKIRPYQGSVRVPMIISGPKHLVPKRGVSDELVELRDVLATMSALAGDNDTGTDGINMLGEVNRDYIHGEHTGGEFSNHYIVTKDFKYIWYSQTGIERFFDLKNDPTETHDAINDKEYQQKIAELKSNLISELEDREEGFVVNGDLVVGVKVVPCLSHIL